MIANVWMSFLVTKAVISATPGPAVMLVISRALARSRGTYWTALGIVLVNAVFFALAATGLGALISVSSEAFALVKWVAVIVLIAAGIRTLIRGAPLATAPQVDAVSGRRAIWGGALLQLSNPNALLFFGAVLPQFIDPHARLVPQLCVLGAIGLLVDACVLCAYGAIAERCARLALSPRQATIANRAGGCLLMAAGLYTAILR